MVVEVSLWLGGSRKEVGEGLAGVEDGIDNIFDDSRAVELR